MIRKSFTTVYADGSDFEIGKGVTLKEGKDVAIIASGIMVDEALKAQEQLASEGISAKVIDMFTWKPLDEQLILDSAKECGAIVTAENHQVKCGLGSAVCERCHPEQPGSDGDGRRRRPLRPGWRGELPARGVRPDRRSHR